MKSNIIKMLIVDETVLLFLTPLKEHSPPSSLQFAALWLIRFKEMISGLFCSNADADYNANGRLTELLEPPQVGPARADLAGALAQRGQLLLQRARALHHRRAARHTTHDTRCISTSDLISTNITKRTRVSTHFNLKSLIFKSNLFIWFTLTKNLLNKWY